MTNSFFVGLFLARALRPIRIGIDAIGTMATVDVEIGSAETTFSTLGCATRSTYLASLIETNLEFRVRSISRRRLVPSSIEHGFNDVAAPDRMRDAAIVMSLSFDRTLRAPLSPYASS